MSEWDDGSPLPSDDDAPGNVVPIRKRNGQPPRKPSYDMPTQLEIDAARRFVERYGADLRYSHGRGWLAWEGTHWRADTRERARELAKRIGDDLRMEAAAANDRELWAIARSVGRARGIGAVLDCARSDERIRVGVEELDARSKSHLLAVANGVVDLRTSELRPHSRDDLFTRASEATYQRTARFEPFDRMLEHLVPDADARAYLQRAVGYTLTASATEDVIFLLVGAPRCGKSTLMRAISEGLGEHAASASMRSFCNAGKNPNPNQPRSDLFRLVGRRMVIASEITPGLEFDVGLLKAVSGGEMMPVRELHQPEIEVRTTWTLWLVANEGDLPKVRAEDDAVWERIRRIPVGSTLPESERSPALRESFSTPQARSAVLAWAVEGARMWFESRLGAPPESVRKASAELRSTMDPAAPFIAAELRFDPATVTSKRQVRAIYTKWAEDRGDKPMGAKRFTASLRGAAQRIGVELLETTTREAGNVVPAWRGLRPVTQHERECRDVETCRDRSLHLLAGAGAGEKNLETPLQASTPLQETWSDDDFID